MQHLRSERKPLDPRAWSCCWTILQPHEAVQALRRRNQMGSGLRSGQRQPVKTRPSQGTPSCKWPQPLRSSKPERAKPRSSSCGWWSAGVPRLVDARSSDLVRKRQGAPPDANDDAAWEMPNPTSFPRATTDGHNLIFWFDRPRCSEASDLDPALYRGRETVAKAGATESQECPRRPGSRIGTGCK